jgi:hypothetical protein
MTNHCFGIEFVDLSGFILGFHDLLPVNINRMFIPSPTHNPAILFKLSSLRMANIRSVNQYKLLNGI